MANYAQRKGRESKKREELKKQLSGSTFTPLRHDVVNSPQFLVLSLSAKWVFIRLCGKYNRLNNGDLSAPLTQAKEEFNLSTQGLKNALDELVKTKFLEITRQGNKKLCSLFALTCYPLNEINKAGLFLQSTSKPKDSWKQPDE